jgi:hypothetical protein
VKNYQSLAVRRRFGSFSRATDESRTRDLTITNRLLYQLSYGGIFFRSATSVADTLFLLVSGGIIKDYD